MTFCAECKRLVGVSVTRASDNLMVCVECYQKPKEKPTARAVGAPAKKDFRRGFKKRAEMGVYDS